MTGTKTSLANSYIKGKPQITEEFSELTLGFKENIKEIKLSDKILFLNLIECPNSVSQFFRFFSLIKNKVNKKGYCIIFGYDITNLRSIIEIEKEWVPKCKDIINKENVRVYLVGNKLDIQSERKVSKKEAKNYSHFFLVLNILKFQTKLI